MNLKGTCLVVVSLIVGGLLGNTLGGSKLSRLDGRLSACKDMMQVINSQTAMQFECSIHNGDVYISTPLQPGVLVSLDGKDVIR